MSMKLWAPLLIALLLFSACALDPNLSKAEDEAANPALVLEPKRTPLPAASKPVTPTAPDFASHMAPMGTGLVPDNDAPVFAPGDLADCYICILEMFLSEDSDRKQPQIVLFSASVMGELDKSERDKLLKAVEKFGAKMTVVKDNYKVHLATDYNKDTNGFVFVLADKPMSDGITSIRAGVWRAPLAGYGWTRDITQMDGGWEIGPMQHEWIS